MDIDTTNYQAVGVRGSQIVVLKPRLIMSPAEAIIHAAWLVVLSGLEDEFLKTLVAVKNT